MAVVLLQVPDGQARPGAENDLFIQQTKLKNTLRAIAGEETIDHLGMDYYGDDLSLPSK